MRLFVSGFKAWVNFKTDFLCLILSIRHVLLAFVSTRCTKNKKPFLRLRDRKKKLWRSFRAWGSWSEESIHHIYQDIQKGPVLTLIFNGILTWTCRLIYDTFSQDRVNNTNIFIFSIILFICLYINTFWCDNRYIRIFLSKGENRVENYWW